MKRTSRLHLAARSVLFASLVLSTVAAAPPASKAPKPAGTQSQPAPATGAPDVTRHPKFKGWINSVPDTGQFLPDSVWLVRVGPRVTTVGDFVKSWFASEPEYRPSADSAGRVQFMQSLVHKDILGLTALSIDRPLQFEDRLALRQTRQSALAGAVFRRFVSDSVKVDESEVRALWDTYKWEQHARHIMVADRNAAEKVRRDLVSGRVTWAAAVRRYSLASDTSKSGDLGWVQRDRMEPSIGNAVFSLKPGEISQPLQDAQGWHVVQSIERRPKDPPAYEAFSSRLREEISSAKQAVYVERMLAFLRAQEQVQYDSANVRFACSQFRTTIKSEPMDVGIGSSIEVDASIPEFTEADTSRLLVRWRNGGRFSIGDLLATYSGISPVIRPSLTSLEAMIGFVETLILEPKIAEYGAQRGLEEDPLVASTIARKREQLLVEHMYQDSVARFIYVTRDERKAYYQANLRSFFTYPSVDFAAIVRPTKAGADSVQRALRSGVPAQSILAADSAAGFHSGSIQNRTQPQGGPYHKVLFEEMRPGDVQTFGPDRQGDFVVIQLIHYDGGRQLSYEESEQMIDESLQNQKAEKAIEALIGRLRPRFEVASRPELVMLIRLADPGLD